MSIEITAGHVLQGPHGRPLSRTPRLVREMKLQRNYAPTAPSFQNRMPVVGARGRGPSGTWHRVRMAGTSSLLCFDVSVVTLKPNTEEEMQSC